MLLPLNLIVLIVVFVVKNVAAVVLAEQQAILSQIIALSILNTVENPHIRAIFKPLVAVAKNAYTTAAKAEGIAEQNQIKIDEYRDDGAVDNSQIVALQLNHAKQELIPGKYKISKLVIEAVCNALHSETETAKSILHQHSIDHPGYSDGEAIGLVELLAKSSRNTSLALINGVKIPLGHGKIKPLVTIAKNVYITAAKEKGIAEQDLIKIDEYCYDGKENNSKIVALQLNHAKEELSPGKYKISRLVIEAVCNVLDNNIETAKSLLSQPSIDDDENGLVAARLILQC